MCLAVGGQCFGFCRRFNGRNKAKRWISGDSRNQFCFRDGLSFNFRLGGCNVGAAGASRYTEGGAAIAIMAFWCIDSSS